MTELIRFENLTKRFKKKIILDKIDLCINKGEIFGIIGMSGSGKTTLLKTLIGFLEPEMGDIVFFSEKEKKFKSIYKNQIESTKLFGFSTQEASFYPRLTVEENLLHFASLYHLPKSIRRNNAKRLLQLTGLLESKNLLAKELSGGMEKKLSIACSLVHNPKVLILDEPTSDLDPLSRKETWQIIKSIHDIGTTIIVASHFLNELEDACDRIGILYEHKLIAVGTPEKIKDMYFKEDEITLKTVSRDYHAIEKAIKRYSSRDIKKMYLEDDRITFHTIDAEKTLHHLLHVIEKTDEKVVSIDVTKPPLARIFESLKRR